VLGGLGYAAYAAGNIYMDAFARQKRFEGDRRWLAVNWDAWDFSGEAGVGIPKRGLAALAMNPAEGIRALAAILSTGETFQSIVSTADLNARLRQAIQREAKPAESQGHLALHRRPTLVSNYVEPRHETDRVLAGIWQTLLGVDNIGISDNFFELGGHSLLVTQAVSRLRDTFRMEVSIRTMFDAPTIAQLADALIASDTKPGRVAKIAKALILVQGMSSQDVSKALERNSAAATR
ncbi:MAG: phosphopantetheine-binding protein, partial [Acidobacteriota bacterium]|nr:phosphopantetheine-binding protein [Acidobacteriota bacterium]